MPHVTQTQVHADLGLTILVGLRALLRQDPNIVMVGSVDTQEVAELAASAASRGMLVLGGTSDVSLTDGARIIVFIGVLQRVCQHCRKRYTPTRAELAVLEDQQKGGADFGRVLAALKEEAIVDKKAQWKDLQFYRSVGCTQCTGGYKGMIGIQEITSPQYEGLSLLEDALFKAAQGLISIEDLLRAAGE